MYHIILIVLLLFSSIELFTGKKSVLWFNVSYFLMTIIAVFRYGQMDDYFNFFQYYEAPSIYMEIDVLYGALIMLFKVCSIHFIIFSAFFSLFCMVLAYRFFCKGLGICIYRRNKISSCIICNVYAIYM